MADTIPPATSRPLPVLRASSELRHRPVSYARPAGGGPGRRTVLSGLAGAAVFSATLAIPVPMPAGVPAGGGMPRRARAARSLDIVVAQTGETFADVFAEAEHYDPDKLARLNRLLRDYWTGAVRPVDPALFDLMARVQARVGQKLRVLSGYRSPQTNRFMHLVGFDVAEHSLHMAAKAVDFMVPGVPARTLGEIARQCGAGGVGIYRSGFVHMDTGMTRSWTGT
jgi:uncharacterized protein YcbK (DUF882 family)